ncbi:BrnA antitoxin family protein [Blastochloris sulfoviridis]|nr:BrnA antitoxin family protein [Blastochloris sulfoviridis]
MDHREQIVRLVSLLPDGEYIIELPDGRLEKRKSETDWDRVSKMTDAEIAALMADDPDWQEAQSIDWSKAEVVVPANKVPISIRLDPDVLDFFKAAGPGYQKRINAVLRAYMRAQTSKPARSAGTPARAPKPKPKTGT